MSNLNRAPLYSGQIKSVGPRYCPSLEDKVVRFSGKDQHQIFLEPEGLNTLEVYCNGISTSMPHDVQEAIVHSITGLESAEIVRYGYAIEYDFVPPTQLHPSLETKLVGKSFSCGSDQWNIRLRRSRTTGAHGRYQCGPQKYRKKNLLSLIVQRLTSVCSLMTLLQKARRNRIGCLCLARNTGFSCGRTTPTGD